MFCEKCRGVLLGDTKRSPHNKNLHFFCGEVQQEHLEGEMMRCSRCGGQLKSTDSRAVKDGKVYHLYCNYKIEQQEKEHEDKLRQERGNNPSLPNGGSKGGTRNPEGFV